VGYGSTDTAFGTARAFIRSADGVVTSLGSIPGGPADSYAWAISENGEVVGGTNLNAAGRAWRWTAAGGMEDLNAMLETPTTEFTIVEARGVNNHGEIAATILRHSTNRREAVLLVPTPAEPCPANWNCDDAVNSADFFDFLIDFFDGDADFNSSGATDSQDFFDFLTAFFTPC
jgi:uncharacterized membrane protein